MGEIQFQAGDVVRLLRCGQVVRKGEVCKLKQMLGGDDVLVQPIATDTEWQWAVVNRLDLHPVHPSKVGQRVRALKTGKVGVVIGICQVSASVRFEDLPYSLWHQHDEIQLSNLIVISDTPPEPVEDTEQPADSCVNTTSPTVCGASVDTSEHPAEQGEEVRCPYCGSEMTGEPILEPDCNNWLAICSNKDCQASGPVVSGDEIDEMMRLEALSAARQRHQDGPVPVGHAVEYAGNKLMFGGVNPANTNCGILIDNDGFPMRMKAALSDLRPVPAPKEYTLEELPQIEGVRWERDKDVYGNEWRVVGFDAKFSANRVVVGSGLFETESEAVRDILDRIGRPFAEAAGKEGE